ncbi:hypothetical protein GCM10009801_38320 [Streptomyces albiaxialis]|uniref:Transcriptional regulator n=1 Tax=Streptomyces albiaxialis TaxID=329523 RepID=A0ABP5HN95_9ACTN
MEHGDRAQPCETTTELGEAVRTARDRARLSQRVLAARSGVSLRTLREIERGRVRVPRARSMERLAATLQAPGLLDHGAVRTAERPGPDGAEDRFLLRVLGPLGAARAGVPLNAGTPMQQSLLGLLALHANQSVTHAEIVETLWGEHPPGSFNQLIHTYVSRLRSLLAKHQDAGTGLPRIERRHAGYELRIDAAQLDLLQFGELMAEAETVRATGDPAREARLLADALGLWSGPVLGGCSARLREHPRAIGLAQRQVTAALRFAQLAEVSGDHERAVDQLRPLVRQHPLHEGLHARLMLALAEDGRRVEALDLFGRIDRTLRGQFGIEPGPELRAAQLAVLRGTA